MTHFDPLGMPAAHCGLIIHRSTSAAEPETRLHRRLSGAEVITRARELAPRGAPKGRAIYLNSSSCRNGTIRQIVALHRQEHFPVGHPSEALYACDCRRTCVD